MYLTHFGLNQSPFGITSNPQFFYSGSNRGAILAALLQAVTQGEGVIKVTGQVGSGKTMLCRMLEDQLAAHIDVICLVNPTLARDEVVHAIAAELGVVTSGSRADQAMRVVQDELMKRHMAGRQVVLLVEEAQSMPLDVLEEIRLFSNLETDHHKLLQIVLFGQPELDDMLELPRMRPFKERITCNLDVEPLIAASLAEFLVFRLTAAGYQGPELFSSSAVKRIAQASKGIARRVSILADKSLQAAFADHAHTVEARHVQTAIDESAFSVSDRLPRRPLMLGILLLVVLGTGAALWQWRERSVEASPQEARTVQRTAPAVAVVAPAVPAQPAVAPASSPPAPMPAVASSPTLPANPPVAPATVQGQLSASKSWLDEQPARNYTVQVALLETDPAPLMRFLQKLGDAVGLENLHVYPTRAGKTLRYGVLVSTFPTRPDALAISDRIASELGYKSQLRTFAGLRTEIERTRAGSLWPK